MFAMKMMRTVSLFLIALAADAQTAPLPSNLKAEGIPAIPVELMDRLTQYTDSRTASFTDWHPLRREILITTRFGDIAQIHRVAFPGGARTQLTFGRDRAGLGRYDPESGSRFVISRDKGGNEFYQLYLFDVASGRTTLLTDGHSRNAFGGWSEDGRTILFNSTRRNKKDSDIYVMNVGDPKSARIVLQADRPGWAVEDRSRDGKFFIAGLHKSVDTVSLYEVNVQTGERRALTPDKPGLFYDEAVYSPDPRRVYAITNEGSDFKQLVELDRTTRKARMLRPGLHRDVADPQLSSDGLYLAYIVNDDGVDALRVLDTRSGRDIKLPVLPKGRITTPEWRKNTHEIGFTLASAKSASDVYSIEIDSAKLTRWTTSEIGGLNPEEFVEPELIRWKSFDGLQISGFYYKPPSRFTGRRPVIVNIHGGPEGQFRPNFLGRNNYFLNEIGVALIYPNVRGSTGYGKKFVNLDDGRKREDSVKDIGALLDWIKDRPDLDAGRVMVMGGSYGGYMTLAAMTRYNDRLCCGVDMVGIANWVTFLERTEAYRRDLRRVEYGDERDPEMRKFLEGISPARHANKITKPMFIVQGKNDPRVPYTESEQMVAAIRKNGGTVWYLLAEDEGHGFVKKPNADFQFAATVMFVERHLVK